MHGEAVNIDGAFRHKVVSEVKYLIFELSGEEYGLEILKVKEIIGIMNITAVPRTPGFVKGVINLRGKVIPVIDLRLMFGMESKEYNERTSIIVVDIGYQSERKIMGVVVDSVSEVLSIKSDDVEEAPDFGSELDTEFILGLAKAKGGIKILLDIDRIISSGDMSLIGAMTD